jgi:hypothetical protein
VSQFFCSVYSRAGLTAKDNSCRQTHGCRGANGKWEWERHTKDFLIEPLCHEGIHGDVFQQLVSIFSQPLSQFIEDWERRVRAAELLGDLEHER